MRMVMAKNDSLPHSADPSTLESPTNPHNVLHLLSTDCHIVYKLSCIH